MKKTVLLFALCSFTFAGTASSAENMKLAAADQAKTPPSVPEECTKLVAAIKSCEKAGGFMESTCKQAAKSKYTCPIALDKLM